MGGLESRNYSVALPPIDYDSAHEFCASHGLRLAKWDSEDKYLDVGFVICKFL